MSIILGIVLTGCEATENGNSQIEMNDTNEKKEDVEVKQSHVEQPSQQEIEYWSHVDSITTVMIQNFDLFSNVNIEAGEHPSVMQTEKWWEELSNSLIGFEWAINKYNTSNILPTESQKDIHILILKTHELMRYVADNFGDAISNMEAEEVTKCLDKIREARKYTEKAIQMNNEQFEEWEKNANN
jgi:hypothetical protein